MSVAYISLTLHASDVETELGSLATEMQRLHTVANCQPVDAAYFAQLEHAVNARLDCLAELLVT